MRAVLYIAATFLIAFSTSAQGAGLPVQGIVTSGIGWRPDPFGSGKMLFHKGIDIAVPVGTPVRATRKGKVVFAGERRGYGATVVIEHDNGDRTLYGHNASLSVRAGEVVDAGAVVALSGNSGRSTGPHVHYEQLPSGREGGEEEVNVEVAAAPGMAPDQRRELEMKMEESLKSLLNTIRSDITGG